MIRITVELVPRGDEQKKVTLSVIQVANVKTNSRGVADYQVTLDDKELESVAYEHVRNHPRKLGYFRLCARVFEALHGRRSTEEEY